MSLECRKVHASLIAAGFTYLGTCGTCPQRIKKYQKGKFMVKTYGSSCIVKLFESNNLIQQNVDISKISELIQKAVP